MTEHLDVAKPKTCDNVTAQLKNVVGVVVLALVTFVVTDLVTVGPTSMITDIVREVHTISSRHVNFKGIRTLASERIRTRSPRPMDLVVNVQSWHRRRQPPVTILDS